MKLVALIIVNLVLASAVFAQQINKAKIENINEYIQKANHPLIVTFWATWCRPCIEELPLLQQAIEQNKPSGVELVMVSLDFPEAYPNDILEFIRRKNISATFFWLNETDADHFCPAIDKQWEGSIPATLFVNKETSYRKFFEKRIKLEELDVTVKSMLK